MGKRKKPEERMQALKAKERKLKEEIAAALLVEQVELARVHLRVPDIATALEYLEAAFGDARAFLDEVNEQRALEDGTARIAAEHELLNSAGKA